MYPPLCTSPLPPPPPRQLRCVSPPMPCSEPRDLLGVFSPVSLYSPTKGVVFPVQDARHTVMLERSSTAVPVEDFMHHPRGGGVKSPPPPPPPPAPSTPRAVIVSPTPKQHQQEAPPITQLPPAEKTKELVTAMTVSRQEVVLVRQGSSSGGSSGSRAESCRRCCSNSGESQTGTQEPPSSESCAPTGGETHRATSTPTSASSEQETHSKAAEGEETTIESINGSSPKSTSGIMKQLAAMRADLETIKTFNSGLGWKVLEMEAELTASARAMERQGEMCERTVALTNQAFNKQLRLQGEMAGRSLRCAEARTRQLTGEVDELLRIDKGRKRHTQAKQPAPLLLPPSHPPATDPSLPSLPDPSTLPGYSPSPGCVPSVSENRSSSCSSAWSDSLVSALTTSTASAVSCAEGIESEGIEGVAGRMSALRETLPVSVPPDSTLHGFAASRTPRNMLHTEHGTPWNARPHRVLPRRQPEHVAKPQCEAGHVGPQLRPNLRYTPSAAGPALGKGPGGTHGVCAPGPQSRSWLSPTPCNTACSAATTSTSVSTGPSVGTSVSAATNTSPPPSPHGHTASTESRSSGTTPVAGSQAAISLHSLPSRCASVSGAGGRSSTASSTQADPYSTSTSSYRVSEGHRPRLKSSSPRQELELESIICSRQMKYESACRALMSGDSEEARLLLLQCASDGQAMTRNLKARFSGALG